MINNYSILLRLVFVLDILVFKSGYSQELENRIPPSPTAMQFLKYAEYPVSNFTGIPDIKIPLYEIREGDLVLPIYLQYHSSGTKGADVNGNIALGWSLMCGATIYRTIVDEPDELRAPIANLYSKTYLESLSTSQRDNLLRSWEEYGDTEPDVFTYKIGNLSGKFVLKRNTERTPMLMPFNPIKISTGLPGSNITFSAYDEKGVKYEFVDVESPDSGGKPTGWGIKKMISAATVSNYISFTYIQGPIEFVNDRIDYYNLDDNASDQYVTSACNHPNGENFITDFMVNSTPDTNPYSIGRRYSKNVLNEINFRGGKIRFVNETGSNMLRFLEIYDINEQLTRKIELSRILKSVNRFLLKEVKFLDKDGAKINSYKMKYYAEENGTIPSDVNVDLWGYITTGSSANMFPSFTVGFSTPYGTILNRTLGSNSRNTDEEMMKTFVLKEIAYPTGGYSVFDYEANRRSGFGNSYSGYYSSPVVGGLRVKSIANYKSIGEIPEMKSYVYGTWQQPESGIGIMDLFPTIDDFRYTTRTYIVDGFNINFAWQSFRNNYFLSTPYTNIVPQGSPVVYTSVTEYLGTAMENLGKTVYNFSYQEPEYTWFDTNGSGLPSSESPYYKRFLYPFKDWLTGNLINKVYYKKAGNSYVPAKAESYIYQETNQETLKALYLERFVQYTKNHCASSIPDDQYDSYVYNRGNPYPISVYNYGDYEFVSAHHDIAQKEITIFDDEGLPTYSTLTEFFYNNPSHGQLTSKKEGTSEGEKLVTTYSYPHDYPGQQVYDEMVGSKHIWSAVIEEKQYLEDGSSNLQELSARRNNYSIWNGDVSNIQLESIETSKEGSNYEPRIRYHSYDGYGNPTSVSKEYGKFINYIWGYGGRYPIAQVDEADIGYVISLLGGNTAVQNFCSQLNPTDSQVEAFLAPLRGMWYSQHVNTYTYRHLYGMTGHTDAHGKRYTYEYDGFQRLKGVKDGQGNLLKAYDYQFKP